jgi:Mrp family chromosome partitioning ATPase
LYFLPAGSLSDVATELLFSERMASVTRQLVNLQPNLLVLFDSSPTLVTVEARALAVLMSQILVVVRANATPQPVVRQTLELLAEGGSKVSLILNDARELGAPGYSYGGSYGDARRAST